MSELPLHPNDDAFDEIACWPEGTLDRFHGALDRMLAMARAIKKGQPIVSYVHTAREMAAIVLEVEDLLDPPKPKKELEPL